MSTDVHVKCPLFLSHFNETSIFLTDVGKNLQIPNLMKISPVAAGDPSGQTDMTKLTVVFGSFVKAPKKETITKEHEANMSRVTGPKKTIHVLRSHKPSHNAGF
jgi:hypothetical protein